jgi:ElaB/YqjD/DUF883 family membrane-anchored ribosome-binding protein
MTSDPTRHYTPTTTPEPVNPPPLLNAPKQSDGATDDERTPVAHPASSMEHFEHVVADDARSAAHTVDIDVRVYPWGAILASAAAGLVLGLLAGRG